MPRRRGAGAAAPTATAAGPSADKQPADHAPLPTSAVFAFGWADVVVAASLFALCAALYANSLEGDFVFDDRVAVVENADVDPSRTSLGALFRHNFWGDEMGSPASRHHSYRPLTVLSFRWTFVFFGMDKVFFHAGNVVLHGLVTVLFERACRLFFAGHQTRLVSLLAAVLFAAHPIHSEAVAGIVGRAELLAAATSLLALLAFARACAMREERSGALHIQPRPHTFSIGFVLLAVVLAGASMLCKETGVAVIGIVAVFDLFVVCGLSPGEFLALLRAGPTVVVPSRRGPQRVWPPWLAQLFLRQILIWAATAMLLVLRFSRNRGDVVETDWITNPSVKIESFVYRVLTKLFYNAMHAYLLVYPNDLCADWSCHSIPVIESIADPRNLGSLTLVLVLGGLSVFSLTRPKTAPGRLWRQLVVMSLAFVVIPFLPATGFILNVGFVVADRLLYTPSMGFCLLLSAVLYQGVCGLSPSVFAEGEGDVAGEATPESKDDSDDKNATKRAFPQPGALVALLLVAAALVIPYSAKTVWRNQDWRSERTIFGSALDVVPGNCKMHHNYATTLDSYSEAKEKEFHLRKSLELHDEYTAAYINLGFVLAVNNRLEEAVEVWEQGLKRGRNVVGNDRPSLLTNLAQGHKNLGNFDKAKSYYEKALRLRPRDEKLLQGLAFVKQQMGAR